jgi:hypothetical protein
VHWFTDATAALIVGAFFLLGVELLLTHQHMRHPCPLLAGDAGPTARGSAAD